MDYETRAAGEDHDALRLWLRLLTCSKLIESEVRRSLHNAFECTLPRFDLMAQLYREPSGLSMGALSKRMMVTGGNVTGIANQLERDRLLSRCATPDDRRQIRIQLTSKGKREFARMARVHEQWIVELFGGISDDERGLLFDLLKRLKTSMLEKAA